MIETTLRDYLAGNLSVYVGYDVPKGPPESYVILQKTGSSNEDGLYGATFAIQSIAKNRLEAMALNDLVKTAMSGFTGINNIFRCHCDSDYDFTNTITKEPRYQAVFHIVYKE